MPELCFFCGGHQDLQTMFPCGGEYTGAAAHQCSMCHALIAPHQVAIFEATEQDPGCGNPQVQPGIWFTGRWTTMEKQYLHNIYPAEIAARVAKAGAGTLGRHRYRAHRLDVYSRDMLQ